jgi:cytochrome c biogenesis protein CcmG, thiol:disulfide interchange protein DsbE
VVEFRKMAQHRPISRRKALSAIGSGLSIPRIVFALDSREPAPKFRAKTMDGETITNDSIQGKVVLLQFWATWCPYCKRDLPTLERLGQEFESQGLMVLGVNVGESKRKVKQFLEQSPRWSRVILMEDTNLAAVFDAKSFPLYVLIDRKGKLAGTQEGSGGEGALRHLLRKAALDSREDSGDRVELQSSPRQH